MSNVASERVVNGIKTRVLHGKDYVEVAERVRIVQHDETAQGFSMVKQERYEWNGRHFISVTIEVKGKLYIGDAEVTFTAPKNTPAGTSPVETAQTSALGRALAFAGYGTVESIASFDEVYRAISIEESGRPVVEAARQLDAPKAAPGTEHLTNGNGTPAFPAMPQAPTLADITSLFGKLYKPERFPSFKQMVLERTVADLDLTEDDRVKLWDKLVSIKRAAKGNEQPAA